MDELAAMDVVRVAIFWAILLAAFLAAFIFLFFWLPQALRARGILTGRPPVPYWHMMLLRAAVGVVLLSLILFTRDRPPQSYPGQYPVMGVGKGAEIATLAAIVVDAILDTTRRLFGFFRRRANSAANGTDRSAS